MKQLKDKVKEIRRREGLSQEEMGKRVGYTNRASINKIENGNGDVPFDKLIDLINEYLLELNDLTNKDVVEYSLRDLNLDDWKELIVVYKDAMCVPFFNSDNCHGDIFYYSTEKRMKKAIGFWMDSTSKGYFVRKAVDSLLDCLDGFLFFIGTTRIASGNYRCVRC
jgi:DNA-binding XRE family transcriptional regulator